MALSRTKIINKAMILLGEPLITSPTETTKRAKFGNEAYDEARDAVLRAHPWNFAMARATLNKDASDPDWGFANRFPLPTSPKCLRVIVTEDDTISGISAFPWKVEGLFILTDAEEMKIRYTSQVADETKFDSLFAEAFGTYLAVIISVPLIQDKEFTSQLNDLYDIRVRQARGPDAQEGTPDDIVEGTWIESRA